MAAPKQVHFGHRIEALGFEAYLRGLKAMSVDQASGFGAGVLSAIGPALSAHKTALRNLRLAFPQETEAWRRDVARAMWAEIGRTAGEFPHLGALKAYEEGGRIEVVNPERLDAVRESGQGAVFISGHFSNWELLSPTIVQRGVKLRITYRPTNNPLVNDAIIRMRSQFGLHMQAAKGMEGGMALMRALGRGDAVALMNDQKYNEGVSAPLFGHPCMTADGPARLALRFGVPLIPMSIRRVGGVRFRITVHEPIALDRTAPATEAAPAAVMRINALIEGLIREAPEQWFWVHRRWPKEAWVAAGAM